MQTRSTAYIESMSENIRPASHMKVTIYTETPLVFTDDDIISFNENKSAHPIAAELPTISVSLTVDNTDGRYDPDSPTGLYDELMSTLKMTYEYGVDVYNEISGELETEWITGGEVYTTGELSYDNTSFTIEATDHLALLTSTSDITYNLTSWSDIAKKYIEESGYPEDALGEKKIIIDSSLDNYQTNTNFPDLSIAEILQSVAHAGGVQMYIDRSGYLHLDNDKKSEDPSQYHLTLDEQGENPTYSKKAEAGKVTVVINTDVTNIKDVESVITSDGEDVEVENDFIETTPEAENLMAVVKGYLQTRNTAEISYRGEPALDILDRIQFDTEYSTGLVGTVIQSSLTYAGNFSGSLTVLYSLGTDTNTSVTITGAENFVYSGESSVSPAFVTLTCNTDEPSPTYQWSYYNSTDGWQDMTGETSQTLTLYPSGTYFTPTDLTIFKCTVNDSKSATAKVRRIRETETETGVYLGSLTSIPEVYGEGDYFLCAEDFDSYTLGNVYIYDGENWQITTNATIIASVLRDAKLLGMPYDNPSFVNQYIQSITQKSLTLSASASSITVSERSGTSPEHIIVTARASGLDEPGSNWVWRCYDGSVELTLSDVYDENEDIDPYSRQFSCADVTTSAVTVTLTVTEDEVYSASIGFSKTELKDESNIYLGVLDLAPDDDNYITGDYYLSSDNIPYVYNGTTWVEVTEDTSNYSEIMGMVLGDAIKSGTTIPVTSAIYGYFENLVTRNLLVSNTDGSFQFSASPTAGTGSSGNAVPAVLAKIDDEVVFEISEDGIYINGNGTFTGVISNNEFETRPVGITRTINQTLSPTLWSGADLYAVTSIPIDDVLLPATGTYKDKNIVSVGRTTSGGRITIATFEDDSTQYGDPVKKYNTYTIPNATNKAYYWIHASGGFFTGGTSLEMYRNSSQYSSLAIYDDGSKSSTKDAQGGDIVKCYVWGWGLWGKTTGYCKIISYYEGPADGTVVVFDDGSTKFFYADGLYEDELVIDTIFTSSNTYIDGSALFTTLMTVPSNELTYCDSASSTITIDGTAYTLLSILKTSTNIRLNTGGGIVNIQRWSGEERDMENTFTSLSVNIVTSSTQPGVYTSTVFPKGGATIGTADEPFDYGYFTDLNVANGLGDFSAGDVTLNSLSADSIDLDTDNLQLSSTGYTRLPNGLLLQWGSGTGTITFPIAFSTVYQAVISLRSENRADQIDDIAFPYISELSNSGLTAVYRLKESGDTRKTISVAMRYIAIGV